MHTSRENFAKGLLIGAVLGAVAGGALALLLAPKAGDALRKELRSQAGRLFDDAATAIEKVRARRKAAAAAEAEPWLGEETTGALARGEHRKT